MADAQHGRISTRQLTAIGWSDQAIRTAANNGRLRRVRRGIYAVGHLADTAMARETEALLSVGDGAVLASFSVLSFHGLLPAPPQVHVAVLGPREPKHRPGIRVHRYRDLSRRDIRILKGVPLTTVERALVDAAPELGDHQLEQTLAEALFQHKTSRTKLAQLLESVRGHAGQARLNLLLDQERPAARTESKPQERLLALLRKAGLDPETEVELYGFRVDLFFADANVAIEVDPFGTHDARKRSHRRDRHKDRVLREQGIDVIRLTDEDIAQKPLELVAHIAGEVRLGRARAA
ncbi:MAG: type IV toxin-antitoxin system AbiEi family antitoxin domain-containing protein [Solirubrobacterales bacterium]|nr:type IV toxin-antitoxin system AbiEi family antitoxin domain-containing protein [Solirubrobacterales bacterium]